ncbi:MAG: signal peptidase I [Clostridiales bacterium]|nr:signal peptidase I [Clostridiales bacterium]
MKKEVRKTVPAIEQLQAELKREKYKFHYKRVMKSTLFTLIVVAAFAILVATLWLPVLQIYGTSMTPTLDEGEIVISIKSQDFSQGDLAAFYIGNKILVKRVIAQAGDMVNILDDGTVIVNGRELDEPYVSEKALGECDLEFPYQVPESRYFLMGDHRATSVDSRSSMVGCIANEQLVGKIVFRVWPFTEFGVLK